jgi:hypothetical protein
MKYHQLKQTINLFFNKNDASRTVFNGSKVAELHFNIPNLKLSKHAKMKLSNLGALNASSTTTYTIRCSLISNSGFYDSSNSMPILYLQKDLRLSYMSESIYEVANAENINNIIFYLSDNMDDLTAGTGIVNDIKLSIGLVIYDYDIIEVSPSILPSIKKDDFISSIW